MRTLFLLAAGCLCLGATAHAQAPAGSAAPLETLEIGKAQGGSMMDESAGAGGYGMISRTYSIGRAASLSKEKLSINTDVRFQKVGASAKDKPEQLVKGKCTTTGEIHNTLWVPAYGVQIDTTTMSDVYNCVFEGLSATDYAFELSLPRSKSTNVKTGPSFGIGIQKDGPDKYKDVYLARMLYKGKLYSAEPTAIDAKQMTRVIKGFAISSGGAQVGRIDFVGGARNKGKIIAPAAGSADREAVIFMALTLLYLPDASSPVVAMAMNH